jgi:hypothetical protein
MLMYSRDNNNAMHCAKCIQAAAGSVINSKSPLAVAQLEAYFEPKELQQKSGSITILYRIKVSYTVNAAAAFTC